MGAERLWQPGTSPASDLHTAGFLLLTFLLAGGIAAFLLRRQHKQARFDDSTAALARLLSGEVKHAEPSAEGRKMEKVYDVETGDIDIVFRHAHECNVTAERRLDHAEELKSQGNQAFRSSNFSAAATCYASALLALEEVAAGKEGNTTVEEGGAEPPLPAEGSLACGLRVAMRLQEGVQVEVEGIVCYDNEDGTYDIMLEDGSDRDGVPRAHIRPLPQHPKIGQEDEVSDCRVRELDKTRRCSLKCACLINSARSAFQTGQYRMAVGLATKGIDLNPANPAAFFVRGRAYLAIPYLDLAKQDVRQACLVEPQNIEYRNVLSQVKEKIKVRDEGNRETAALMLSYMRAEGVTAAAIGTERIAGP